MGVFMRLFAVAGKGLTGNGAYNLHNSAVLLSSPFIKAQKKMDPEIAKIREERKRRKLKKEIKLLESFGKKPKPVEEFILDKNYEANIMERVRPPVKLSEEERDERVLAERDFVLYLNSLAVMDRLWINESIRKQEKALQKLKLLSPELYEAAIRPDEYALQGFVYRGPSSTPPLERYEPPDGHYVDVSKKWLC